MPRACVLTPNLIPVGQVQLGALITNPGYPYQDPLIVADPVHNRDYFSSPSTSFHSLASNTKGTEFFGRLTTLVSGAFKWDSKRTENFNGLVETMYEMNHPCTWFRGLCSNPHTREWLHECLVVNCEVFLIAGFRTLTDPKVSVVDTKERSMDFSSSFDGDAIIVAQTGIPINTGGALKAAAGTSIKRAAHAERSYEKAGEFVYGIHYRKVKFKLLSRDRVSTARLDQSNVWIDLTQQDTRRDSFTRDYREPSAYTDRHSRSIDLPQRAAGNEYTRNRVEPSSAYARRLCRDSDRTYVNVTRDETRRDAGSRIRPREREERRAMEVIEADLSDRLRITGVCIFDDGDDVFVEIRPDAY